MNARRKRYTNDKRAEGCYNKTDALMRPRKSWANEAAIIQGEIMKWHIQRLLKIF